MTDDDLQHPPIPAWPFGTGELAGRIREHDWSATPLGPSEAWPQSLKATVNLVLAHGFPMCVLWGPARIALYNDAYRPLLGDKHPALLGRALYDVWPEQRDLNEPLIQLAGTGETVSFKEAPQRDKQRRVAGGAWFDATISPLRDDAGGIAGVLVTAFETTGRVLAEQRRDEAIDTLVAREEQQAFLLKLSDALRPLDDAAAVAQAACRLLTQHLGSSRTRYAVIEGARGAEMGEARGEHVSSGQRLARRLPLAPYGEAVVALLQAGQTLVLDDAAQDPRLDAGAHDAFRSIGTGAAVSVPLVKKGGLIGALTVHQPVPHHWTPREIGLVEEVAERTWAAMERAGTEAALRDSERRLQRVLETDAVAVLFFKADGTLIDANEVFLQIAGYSRADIQSGQLTWQTLTPAAYLAESQAQAEKFLRTGRIGPYEKEYLRKDGTRFWMLFAGRDLGDGTIVELGVDIKARKCAEAALRDSEERLRQFGEASHDVLWIRDARSLQWEYLTPAFETVYGLDREAALRGDNMAGWLELVVPDDRGHAAQSLLRVREGEWATFEYRIRRPADGRVRWLRNTDFPIKDEAGHVVRIGGIVHDITELKQAQEALGEEKERFRTLAEGIPQLVWRSGDDGLWTWSSPQWQQYTGQTQAQSLGWGWLDPVHPDDHDATMRAWQAARPHGSLDVEFRVRRDSDGAWRWHATRSVPLRAAPGPGEAEGSIVEWLGTTTDIQDLKQLQAQQEVMVAELQHRTRNLLAVVRSVARRSIPASPGRDEYEARLSALGRVQGFLSRSPFYKVLLAELLDAELVATGNGASEKVVVGGPAVELPGEGVQAVALALHELATNAVKYGALAHAAGRLSVTWRVDDAEAGQGRGGDRSRLVLDWVERGVAMPQGGSTRRGYGTELLTKALPYQLQAETELEFRHDGVRCRITLPATAFTVDRE